MDLLNLTDNIDFQERKFLNNLDILELLGTGSNGKIYKCYHRGLNKFVAVKFIEHAINEELIDCYETMEKAQVKNELLKNIEESTDLEKEYLLRITKLNCKYLLRMYKYGKYYNNVQHGHFCTKKIANFNNNFSFYIL